MLGLAKMAVNFCVDCRYDPSCDEYHASYDASKDCAHNSWELYRMPIKASFCDAWWTACKHDKFCAADGGPRRGGSRERIHWRE